MRSPGVSVIPIIAASHLGLAIPQRGMAQDFYPARSLLLSDASFLGEHTYDGAGNSVSSAGDVNGDGRADILIGASGNDDAGEMSGQTYLILSRPPAGQRIQHVSMRSLSGFGSWSDCRKHVSRGFLSPPAESLTPSRIRVIMGKLLHPLDTSGTSTEAPACAPCPEMSADC